MTMGMRQHPGALKPTLDRKELVFSNIDSVYEHLHSRGRSWDRSILGILLLYTPKNYAVHCFLYDFEHAAAMLNILHGNKCILYRMSCELWFALALHIIMQSSLLTTRLARVQSHPFMIAGSHNYGCTSTWVYEILPVLYWNWLALQYTVPNSMASNVLLHPYTYIYT